MFSHELSALDIAGAQVCFGKDFYVSPKGADSGDCLSQS